jgi:hypothetical protein
VQGAGRPPDFFGTLGPRGTATRAAPCPGDTHVSHLLRKSCLVVLCALLLVSMGSCGGDAIVAVGNLQIANDPGSLFTINGVEIAGPPNIAAPLFLVPGDTTTFVDLPVGFYDVEIFWTDATSDVFLDVLINEGLTASVVGLN